MARPRRRSAATTSLVGDPARARPGVVRTVSGVHQREGMNRRDDMGEQLLAEHPRGEQWLQLDVTVANLTFDQLERLARLVEATPGLAPVREQLIAALPETGELAGRLASRWVRWAGLFGLPQPDLTRSRRHVLGHPYRLTTSTELDPLYLNGVLGVFDAGLGITAAPATPDGESAYERLTAAWRRVCLPSRFTPASAYGPHTQPALALLRQARDLAPATAARVLAARTALDPRAWSAARSEVHDAGIGWGFPFRSQSLFWEAVPAAEAAADQSPTDPALADALWGAAAAHAFTGRLTPATAALLRTPWQAALRPHPII
jgi:hypothetical protein